MPAPPPTPERTPRDHGTAALVSLLSRAWGSVLVLAALQLTWLLALPLTLFAVGTAVPFYAPLLAGALVSGVRLVVQQRVRRTLRATSMVHSARTALGRAQGVAEASTDAAFWAAYVGEYAVATTVPALVASAVATGCVLVLAAMRLGLRVVVPVAAVLGVAAIAGLLTNRRLRRFVASMVQARATTAAWMAAAARDVGELSAPRARGAFLARVESEATAWSVAEDRYERRRALHRVALGGAVVAALLAVTRVGGVDLRALALSMAHAPSARAWIDAALFASSLPTAYSLARHLDGLLTAREELRSIEPPAPIEATVATVPLNARPETFRARDLVLRYGAHEALRMPDLEVSLGAPLALVGVNGSGKTTLAALLAGALRPSEGAVTVDGIDAHTLDRDRVAYVPQDPVLIESLSIGDNARLAVPSADDAAVAVALARLGLTRSPGDPAGSLSRGERRRIAVARALLREPSLLILDEPDAWLDAAGRATLLTVLREESARRAIVLVTHRADMLPLASTVVLLAPSRGVVAVGPPADLARTSADYRRVMQTDEPAGLTGS